MINVLFVCHGNICRSTMAEFLFKYMVEIMHKEELFHIESCGTSDEENGNPVHCGTKKILDRFNIDCSNKRARKVKKEDYDKFDYIIAMDNYNIKNLLNFFNGDKDNKISLLLSFSGDNRDVIDPWYTGHFEETFNDISKGLNAFTTYLMDKGLI